MYIIYTIKIIVNCNCAGHGLTTPARVSVWTDTCIPTDIATSLLATATRTTPTASVIPATPRRTPTRRASTSGAVTTTGAATTTTLRVSVTGTTVSVIIEG